MSSAASGPSALPISLHRDPTAPPRPPVWPVTFTSLLQERCSRSEREGGKCCRETTRDDSRTLIDPDIVRDIVIGLADGLTVPFALTAGLSSLGQSRLVVMGGLAELISGAISMGIGGFLASQADRDRYRFTRRQTALRVQRSCTGEMEREVFAVLGPVGVNERAAQTVAMCLLDVEGQSDANGHTTGSTDEEKQRLGGKKDVGLTPFFLKFGEGLEEVPTKRLFISAVTIGLGYLLGGIVPLLPYFFISQAHVALLYSCILTGVILITFGVVKSRVTGAANSLLGYLWGAVSTLLVGGAAAAAAYGIVVLVEK